MRFVLGICLGFGVLGAGCGADTKVSSSGHGASGGTSAGLGGAGGHGGGTTTGTGGATTTGTGGAGGGGECAAGEVRECYSGPQETIGVGPCKAGTQSCTDGKWGACTGEVTPQPEACHDENCDGHIGEGDECLEGTMQPCYSGPPGTLGVGVCTGGITTYANGVWGPCTGEVLPSAETCNGLDDDCDGITDPPPCE